MHSGQDAAAPRPRPARWTLGETGLLIVLLGVATALYDVDLAVRDLATGQRLELAGGGMTVPLGQVFMCGMK